METRREIKEIFKKLRPVFGKKIDLLYLKYSLSEDMDERAEIEAAIKGLYHKYLNKTALKEKILLEPPPKSLLDGEYPLGNVVYADKELFPFYIREHDWVRHMLICGMSGSGKTNLAYQILGSLILKEKPFLVFDWKKSFRPLIRSEKVFCFTIGNDNVTNYFKLNINVPPKGISPREWINILVDIITESYFASFGVHKILSEALDRAFYDFGVYKGSENYPTWRQIKDRLDDMDEKVRKGSRESEWLASAQRIAYSLTFGSFGEAINYKGKDIFTIEELMKNQVIFELDSLNSSEKKFFSEFVLTYIYKFKKANQKITRNNFSYAIIVDEAHNIFLNSKTTFLKESIPDMIYREIREYGVSLICLDQHISKLSEVVAGNSATIFAFQQMLPQDIDVVSAIMQLKDKRNYFSMLPVGQAIVKLVERYHDPFLVRVPLVDVDKTAISNAELNSEMLRKTKQYKQKKLFYDSIDNAKIAENAAEINKKLGNIKEKYDAQKAEQELIKILSRHYSEIAKQRQRKAKAVNHIQKYLLDYIKNELSKGFKLNELRKTLLSQGYKRQDIDQAIRSL